MDSTQSRDISKVIENSDGSISIPLGVPIVRKNQRMESLTVRRPTAAAIAQVNFKAVSEGDFRSILPMLYETTPLVQKEVDEIDCADFVFIAGQVIRSFLQRRAV
ncbi:MAG: hypothetical protein LBM75_09200 [Myxococcales bacterium]|jgi:hypothetical protein|nr:hypothetical protein [Myxococcales bacterium]